MQKFMRFFNQNRKDILKVVLIIVSIIGILQLLNYIAKQQNEEQLKNGNINNIIENNIVKYNNVNLETEKSALSGQKISKQKRDSIQIIDKFFEYCNNNKLQEAYDLLTEECKSEMYPSVEIFEKGYYEKIFDGNQKNISVENWNDDIYKIRINDDFLSSGKYSEENTIQDYITIQENKLNVNGYVRKNKINKENKKRDINIKVLEEDIYMEYTTYTFEVTNNSSKAILLDSLKDIDSIYIQDNNGVKYSAYTHELSKSEMLVDEGTKIKLKIKYYSRYGSTKDIKKIVFSKVILDNNQYSDNDYYKFEIEV